MKRLLVALALVLTPLSPVWSQYVLNLRDADIRAFIQDAARVTGRTFIIDPSVQGRVSVVTDRALTRSEYFELFLSTLRANGYVAVPAAGGALRVQPIAGAAASAPVGGTRGGSPSGFITEILRVRNVEATAAVETLRPLVSRDGSITAGRSSIVVSDFADNVRRIRQVLAQIDVDGGVTRLVGLDNAGAREIAGALAELSPEGVTVVAIDSSNAVALRGDAATVSQLGEIAAELDRRAASGSEIRVVFLEHADAEQLLPVLQRLLGQTPTQPSTPRRSRRGDGDNAAALEPEPSAAPVAVSAPTGTPPLAARNAVVTRFEGANAIVISATPDVQRMLSEVVRQLDVRRQQVLVEAIIVEISDTAAQQLGVQLFLAGLRGSNIPFAVTNYSSISPNLGTIAGAIAARELSGTTTTVTTGDGSTTTTTSEGGSDLIDAAAAELAGINGGLAGAAFRSGNAIFGAIVNAVRSDNQSNILSTPSIMTLDNQEARILVGQEIPITTGEALSENFDNTFRTVQRQNVGITLEVRPQINAGGSIKLDLRQEVSSIAGPVSSDFQDLILNKREIETTITVDDGEIVGIGGLLDDNERRTLEKVPLLGDLPVLGNLFRARGRARGRTNLMVFIRPTILRSAADAQAMSARRYGYARSQQLLANPNREPTLDELVRDYLGTVPPGATAVQQPQDAVVAPAEPPVPPPTQP
ncbi:type II secretion system secretin GspD [Sphingosinicella sp. CPCC 101087]|uniref:type II secretion system secretin GspD n=1 Tax=Sphingosinicella sp. CPCC 101087 TaxID=2497754 RepID=UPI00101E0336|nr:type II secretion system secretin GspD [Sphingosinicella sp. CPCC 101087]